MCWISRNHDAYLSAAAPSSAELDTQLLREAGLNPERIRLHQNRIRMALNNQVQTTIPVLGACTTNNGGIVSWKAMTRFIGSDFFSSTRKFQASAFEHWKRAHLLTCIPAAGAASRFLGQLQKFVMEMEGQSPQIRVAAENFLAGGSAKNLSTQEKTELQVWLANKKLPADLGEMGDKIRAQKVQDVRMPHQNLFDALCAFVSGGKMPRKLHESKLALSKKEMGEEFLEVATRTHWNTNVTPTRQPQGGAFSWGTPVVLQDDPDDSFPDLTAKHWTDRLAVSEKPKTKDAQNQADFAQTFLGANERDILDAYCAAKVLLELFGSQPKALVPTTAEGDSFLKLKLAEQVSLFPCSANFLIAPADQKQKFESTIAQYGRSLQHAYGNIFELENTPFSPPWMNAPGRIFGNWHVEEQGRDLSTIRFETSGAPYLTDDGKYSPVAAGHGELVHLFKTMATAYPEAECLHIRNIDNIVGSSADRSHELNVPAETFRLLRDALEFLRAAIDDFVKQKKPGARIPEKIEVPAFYEALHFIGTLHGSAFAQEALGDCFLPNGSYSGVTEQTAQRILSNIFHWPSYEKAGLAREPWSETRELLSRPLSVFGVVRKEVGDVGGGPVFAKLPDGATVKLCMEMPHANNEDSKEYFGTKGKATHFNPVLVFFELRTHRRRLNDILESGTVVDFEQLFDDRFWLLARKEIQGKPVCYHETVLYELIGNSATTNVVFVEVPRTLFNPHKTIFESLGQDRRSYGFEETLQSTEP